MCFVDLVSARGFFEILYVPINSRVTRLDPSGFQKFLYSNKVRNVVRESQRCRRV